MAFFKSCNAKGQGELPPTSVILTADLRTDGDPESAVLEYRIRAQNGVWFNDAPENPGRRKRIRFARQAKPGGTKVRIEAPLDYDPGDDTAILLIQGALLRLSDGDASDECDSQLLIRVK